MPRFILPLLLALIGLILFGQGAYVHAKALVAQVLLERAFAKTIATGQETKPRSWRTHAGCRRARRRRLFGASRYALPLSEGCRGRRRDRGHAARRPDVPL